MKKIQVNIAVTCKFGVKFPVIDAFDLGRGICLYRSFNEPGEWDKWSLGHISSGWRIIGGFHNKANAIRVAEEIILKLDWRIRKVVVLNSEEHKSAFRSAQELRRSLYGR